MAYIMVNKTRALALIKCSTRSIKMFSMRHVKCCCPLANSHLTLDALISAAALDQNKLREQRERERKRARRESDAHRERASLTTALSRLSMWRYRVKILRKQQSYQHEIKFIYYCVMRLCA